MLIVRACCAEHLLHQFVVEEADDPSLSQWKCGPFAILSERELLDRMRTLRVFASPHRLLKILWATVRLSRSGDGADFGHCSASGNAATTGKG
jgi:hypothetical protein